jgi:predicted MFS family arabinose efflux permease
MLQRALGPGYPDAVRQHITAITVARLWTNAALRYLVPFLAVVASGLDVSVAAIGVVLTVGDLCGLNGSWIGRAAHRLDEVVVLGAGGALITMGVSVMGIAPNVAVLAAGAVLLSFGKILFDIAVGTWVAARVPFQRRGRVIGIIETSWAGGLLIGVAAMGLVTAVWSWRWAYAAAAVAVATSTVAVVIRLARERPDQAPAHHDDKPHPAEARARLGRVQLVWCATVALLTASSQLTFVVLGPWLEDEHGVGPAGVSAVVFGLGAVELLGSTTSARLADRWGGLRSVRRGGLLIAPAAAGFALGEQSLAVGLICVALIVLAFEYSIVSSLSVASAMVPGSPAQGLGLMISAATLGRALASIPGTALYERYGASAPAALAAACASGMLLLVYGARSAAVIAG